MTKWVKRNATATTAFASSSTGLAFSPAERQAAPKRKQKTTICSTSPRAIASTMLVGNAFTTTSVNDSVETPGAARIASLTSAPGCSATAANQPSSSAIVVATSKKMTDFQPIRPRSRMLPTPPTARTRTPKSTGAMMARIRRRKMSLTMRSCEAHSGATRPRTTPPAAAASIHCARETPRRARQGPEAVRVFIASSLGIRGESIAPTRPEATPV